MMFLRRVRRLLRREDLRRNPFKGIWRRAVWRLRWKLSSKPWLIRAQGAFPLFAPQSGVAALIYFQGASEPGTANFIKQFLKPGMVFVDVGAHLGEYTILAASILEASGYVHAFEARPDTFEILVRNIELNKAQSIAARPYAVWCEEGFCEFARTADPSVSALRPGGNDAEDRSLIRVPTVTLDRYFADPGVSKPNLIKIDVEGAELQVLKGARSLLSSPESPLLIVEYGRINTAAFGYRSEEVCKFLRELGYTIYQLSGNGLRRIQNAPELDETDNTCNLVAASAALPPGLESL